MNPAVQVRVLGPLEVHRAGRPCPIGSPLQRRLLTALAIAAGAPVAIERLIDQLWEDAPPPAARNSLQSHVARLRGLIGGDTILTRPPGYALDLERVTIDAVDFELAVARARSQLAENPAAAALTLRASLSEWRGVAHAGFAEDLARGESLRLENLRIDARGLLAEAYLLAGDGPAALETLTRLQGDVPLREDVTLAAAGALHAVERTNEALELLRTHRSLVNDELGLDPGPAVTDLENRLLRGEPAPDLDRTDVVRGRSRPLANRTELAPSEATRPPYLGTATLGRHEEQQHVSRALAATRLVTLVGPGGVGKTRLATVVAQQGSRTSELGVAWVDLATATDPADVAPLVIECLGLTSPDRAAADTAATALARFQGLAVLDNCEHVLDRVAEIVQLALASDDGTRILATSRERLDVAGEQVVHVPPFQVPYPRSASDEDPAVRLFQERLTDTGGDAATAAQAAEVAAAVDGLPLAIELAAARAATVPIEELLARLDRHVGLLSGSRRRHGERHRTLANVISWSYDLLSDRDRAVFRRASVFASSFRLADAERVCAGEGLSSSDVVDAVARLVETSMLTRVGAGRYRLLEPLRWFGRERMGEGREAQATSTRHRALVLALTDRADAELTGPGEVAVISELEEALPDLRAVHGRAVSEGDLATVARMTGRLHRFAYAQGRGDVLAWGGHLVEGDAADLDQDERLRAIAASVPAAVWHDDIDEAVRRTRLYVDRLDDRAADPWSRVTLAETLADLHMARGELAAAVAVYERGVELARRCEHIGLTSYMVSGLSIAVGFHGDRSRATLLAREASELARTAGAPTAASLAAYALGEALFEVDPDQALEAFETAVTTASRARAPFFEAIARTADVALRGRYGDPAEAFVRYRAALGIWSETGADGMAITTLRNLVVLLSRTGADTDALTLYTASERLASRPSYGPEAERLRTAVTSVRRRLSTTEREQAEQRAAAVTDVAEVIGFGLTSIERAERR